MLSDFQLFAQILKSSACNFCTYFFLHFYHIFNIKNRILYKMLRQ